MININKIIDENLTGLLNNYESALLQLRKQPYYIDKVTDYSYYLSRLLKSIENNSRNYYSELTEKIKFNSSFEEQLLNHGNRLDNLPSEINLKQILLKISDLISKQNKKAENVFNVIKEKQVSQGKESEFQPISPNDSPQNKILIICNNYDESLFADFISNNALKNIEVNRYKKFIRRKDDDLEDYYIIGYFLEGYRDFEVYHNLSVVINLFLYDFEEGIYKDCLNKYKTKLETELLSEDRFFISGIKYEPPDPVPVSISQALQNIIDRTKDWDKKEFDDNIDDPDERSNEYILYQIEYEGNNDYDYLKSTDTVFNEHNDLKKVNRLNEGDLIRVYKIDFGEILLNTAMEFQTKIFLEIEKHSELWKSVLRDLFRNKYKNNIRYLYVDLKRYGIKVLPSTVLNNWIHGTTKFPKSDKALKAIYELSKDIRLGNSVGFILKSKRIYNSTLISLGRDLKDEIKNFLIEGSIGEIIQKNNITPDTLRKVIDKQMPMKKIKKITTSVIRAEDVDE